MENTKPYCLMPWIHFHSSNKGTVKACCVANIPFGNINEENFEAIWNGKSINQLREKFLKGETDPRCAVCINREKAGVKSIRQETFERFPKIDISTQKLPFYFDIRFSNVCNFRCRTCWHGASSKWFNEAKQLKRNLGATAILQNIEDFEHFVNEMGPALKHAKEIYFAGGEPLVTEEHYRLLDWLIKNNSFPRLRYNTNLSVLKFKTWNLLELWKSFSDVELMASIDASEELGEYIRKEFKWEKFLENVVKIRKIETETSVKLTLSPTVSIMNLTHLPDFYKQCLQLKIIAPKDWYINLLERPYYFNIKAFPNRIKQQIQEQYVDFMQWLRQNDFPKETILSFKSCIDYMNAEDLSKHYESYKIETKQLDDLRNEDGTKLLEIEL